MYHFFYFFYYCFSRFFKDNVPGSIFYNSYSDAVILLSLMEFFNIVSLGIWIKIPVFTTNHNLDMVLVGIGLLGVNFFYFFYGKRYLRVIEYCEKTTSGKKSLFRILAIVYTLLSIYLLYCTHSSVLNNTQ